MSPTRYRLDHAGIPYDELHTIRYHYSSVRKHTLLCPYRRLYGPDCCPYSYNTRPCPFVHVYNGGNMKEFDLHKWRLESKLIHGHQKQVMSIVELLAQSDATTALQQYGVVHYESFLHIKYLSSTTITAKSIQECMHRNLITI